MSAFFAGTGRSASYTHAGVQGGVGVYQPHSWVLVCRCAEVCHSRGVTATTTAAPPQARGRGICGDAAATSDGAAARRLYCAVQGCDAAQLAECKQAVQQHLNRGVAPLSPTMSFTGHSILPHATGTCEKKPNCKAALQCAQLNSTHMRAAPRSHPPCTPLRMCVDDVLSHNLFLSCCLQTGAGHAAGCRACSCGAACS